MGAVTLYDILGAVNAKDFGARGNGYGDDYAALTAALYYLSTTKATNGTLFIPPGTYPTTQPIMVPSNIEVIGAGTASVLQALYSTETDVLSLNGVSAVRIRNLRLDGNRANISSGNGNGIKINNCSDCYFENVEVISARADGFIASGSSRLKFASCRSSDNGRHGFALTNCDFCRFVECDGFDNANITAGGDGFNLDILSHHNTFVGCDGYESSLAGVNQAYGFREVAGGGCYRNTWIGGPCQGNLTGRALVEPDSFFSSYLEMLTGGWGIGTATPNASAMVDLVSVQLGFGLPAMTTVQRNAIASPREGLLVWDTTSHKLLVRAASAWETVTSA